jgi:hypothetical protein
LPIRGFGGADGYLGPGVSGWLSSATESGELMGLSVQECWVGLAAGGSVGGQGGESVHADESVEFA